MKRRITKAIFPVAGFGTRFLPATKSIPKEIMTLVDRPLIQYAIDEARAAGIEEFIFVTSRGKTALEDYFDTAPEIEEAVRAKNQPELVEALNSTMMDSGTIAYVRQHNRRGLGHSVWCARRLLGDEPFAVILPDDVIAADTPCLKQMVEAWEEIGGNFIAAMEVPPGKAHAYGVFDIQNGDGRTLKAKGMIEKPAPGGEPSNLVVVGRYILTPKVMRNLNQTVAGVKDSDGEIQLTDAIAKEAVDGDGVHAFRFEGQRFDCGSKAGLLQATVSFALSRPDLRDDFADFISTLPPRVRRSPK